jgi:hypothetical protein
MMRGGIWPVLFVSLVVASSSFVVASPTPASAESSPTVTVSERPIPSMSHLITSGSFPQLSSRRVNLSAVNQTLWAALLDSERAWQAAVIKRLHGSRGSGAAGKGQYLVAPANFFPRGYTVIGLSSGFVSVLVPVLESYPEGGTGGSWVEATVGIPSGRPIDLVSALFSSPSVGLSFLARTTKRLFLTSKLNPCRSLASACAINLEGFAPNRANFSNIALSAHGLSVGFFDGQVDNGDPLVTASSALLKKSVTSSGNKLLKEVTGGPRESGEDTSQDHEHSDHGRSRRDGGGHDADL